MTPLNKMTPGQKGRVVGFSDDNKVSRRLMELGILPGREIHYLRDAPLKDPMEVKIGECCLSLRHAEAELITIDVEKVK